MFNSITATPGRGKYDLNVMLTCKIIPYLSNLLMILLYIVIFKVETTSTLSTAHSQQSGSGWEDPFNRDSLGDTVIHLEQVR